MAGDSNRLTAGVFVLLLVFSTTSSVLLPKDVEDAAPTTFNSEWVRFDVREDVYKDAVGVSDESLLQETRDALATSPFGVFDEEGLELQRPVPETLLEPRFDVLLLIVSNDMRLHDVRAELDAQHLSLIHI